MSTSSLIAYGEDPRVRYEALRVRLSEFIDSVLNAVSEPMSGEDLADFLIRATPPDMRDDILEFNAMSKQPDMFQLVIFSQACKRQKVANLDEEDQQAMDEVNISMAHGEINPLLITAFTQKANIMQILQMPDGKQRQRIYRGRPEVYDKSELN